MIYFQIRKQLVYVQNSHLATNKRFLAPDLRPELIAWQTVVSGPKFIVGKGFKPMRILSETIQPSLEVRITLYEPRSCTVYRWCRFACVPLVACKLTARVKHHKDLIAKSCIVGQPIRTYINIL